MKTMNNCQRWYDNLTPPPQVDFICECGRDLDESEWLAGHQCATCEADVSEDDITEHRKILRFRRGVK